MGTSALEFIISAKDEASAIFDKIGESASKQQDKLDKFSRGSQVALAALTVAAVKFGGDSIEAYKGAEQSQAQLELAYQKFPALADTNIDALRKLNSELQMKTGYDDDATAAAQATLAQYDLTGDQILKLTPLLQDYANKTGKDLSTSAEDLGKAMMGQGRALKEVGVDFTDTGTTAGNFDQIMGALGDKVGGVAETFGGTAAGKTEILKNTYGDLQETVGALLVPALTKVQEVLTSGLTAFMKTGKSGQILIGVVAGLAVALGIASVAAKANIAIQGIAAVMSGSTAASTGLQTLALGVQKVALGISTAAQWAFNAAMDANPIGLIVLAIAALVAGLVYFFTQTEVGQKAWKAMTEGLATAWDWLWNTILKPYFEAFGAVWTWIWNEIIKPIVDFIVAYVKVMGEVYTWLWEKAIKPAIDGIVGAAMWLKDKWVENFNLIKNTVTTAVDTIKTNFTTVIDFFKGAPAKITTATVGLWNGLTTTFKTTVNKLIDIWNDFSLTIGGGEIMGKKIPSVTLNTPNIPHFAMGTNSAPGGWSLVGERGPELVNLTPGASVMSNAATQRAMSASGSSASMARVEALLDRLIDAVKDGSTLMDFDGTNIARSANKGQRFAAALGAA